MIHKIRAQRDFFQEDCHDGYDESDCPIRNGTVCGEGHFKCKMGENGISPS